MANNDATTSASIVTLAGNDTGQDRFALSGDLTFATVTNLLSEGQRAFAAVRRPQIDLAGVTHADSAGLALLIEWLRQARKQDKQLVYQNLPAQLRALASISDVESLLLGNL